MTHNITKASLADLGAIIDEGETSVDECNACCREVFSRCEDDFDKLGVLLDFHVDKFKRTPDSTQWSELIAMLAAHQWATHNWRKAQGKQG